MENVNVVIVDDNPMILNTLDEVISSEAGLSVIGRADNGKDAIDMIKDTQPDVVLLDLVMPQMDGITVVENIKKKTSMLKNPAFIILSAVGGEQMTEEAFQAGANYFLMKPFDKDILVNKIRRIGKRPVRPVPGKVLEAPLKAATPEEAAMNREEYMKEHLETDITKMLHELGIPCPSQGLSVSSGCHQHGGKGQGDDGGSNKDSVSGDRKEKLYQFQPCRTCHPPCH